MEKEKREIEDGKKASVRNCGRKKGSLALHRLRKTCVVNKGKQWGVLGIGGRVGLLDPAAAVLLDGARVDLARCKLHKHPPAPLVARGADVRDDKCRCLHRAEPALNLLGQTLCRVCQRHKVKLCLCRLVLLCKEAEEVHHTHHLLAVVFVKLAQQSVPLFPSIQVDEQ